MDFGVPYCQTNSSSNVSTFYLSYYDYYDSFTTDRLFAFCFREFFVPDWSGTVIHEFSGGGFPRHNLENAHWSKIGMLLADMQRTNDWEGYSLPMVSNNPPQNSFWRELFGLVEKWGTPKFELTISFSISIGIQVGIPWYTPFSDRPNYHIKLVCYIT